MDHLVLSLILAVCAVTLFFLLQWSLDRASAGRTTSGPHPVQKWISALLSGAIGGAIVTIVLDYLASRLAPAYWGPSSTWDAATAGAVGGMLYQCGQI